MRLVLGHRGARHAAPESTFKAFELALTEGADGVELDVRLDKSGELVVIHDPKLERVSRGRVSALVEELDTAALAKIDVGEGERIPLLRDVLAWAREKNAFLNVEIKSDVRDKKTLIANVVRALTPERDAAERILLSSFHPGFVFTLARGLRELPVAWLVHEREMLFRYAPGWRLLGARGVNPEHSLLSGAFVRRLKAAGARVFTWTVNEPELAVGYAAFGVDGIISDNPGKILEALRARSDGPVDR